jgi:hypothetical protein
MASFSYKKKEIVHLVRKKRSYLPGTEKRKSFCRHGHIKLGTLYFPFLIQGFEDTNR